MMQQHRSTLPNILIYQKPGNDRKWLRLVSTTECNKVSRANHGLDADCDEYPFASNREGGQANF